MSEPTSSVSLHRLDATGFEPWLDRAVEVYLTALERPREVAPARLLSMREHLREPGFRAVAALRADRLIGFGYGYYDQPGQWWHDVVVEALEREVAERWLARAFQVTELHVLPRHQQRGVGERMLHELVRDVPRGTAVLTAYDEPTPARALYRKVGFAELIGGLRFPGNAEAYVVMAVDLPLTAGSTQLG